MGVFYKDEKQDEDADERVLECTSMLMYTKNKSVSLCLVALAKAQKVLSTFYLASFSLLLVHRMHAQGDVVMLRVPWERPS